MDIELIRLMSDGTLDPTFGPQGKVLLDFAGGDDHGHALALAADSRIIVGGAAANATGQPQLAVARLTADGALDTTFGAGGWFVGMQSASSAIAALEIQADGNIVGTGWVTDMVGADRELVVIRLLGP